MNHSVPVGRSNSHIVGPLFQSHAMSQSQPQLHPTCGYAQFFAQAMEFGKFISIAGHSALLPVNFGVGGFEALHPNEPVPVLGSRARTQLVAGIVDFFKHLDTPVPPLDHLRPPSLFPESGILSKQLSHLSKFLSKSQHNLVLDKGAGKCGAPATSASGRRSSNSCGKKSLCRRDALRTSGTSEYLPLSGKWTCIGRHKDVSTSFTC